MRIRDNKTGKAQSLPKLNMKPKCCPMLIAKAKGAFQAE
jgi:hypothetical protein